MTFVGTLVVETPVYVWGLRARIGARRAVGVALAVNLATHPAVFALAARGSTGVFAGAEVAAWIVEAALVWVLTRRACPLGDALVLSFVANALSAGVGLLL